MNLDAPLQISPVDLARDDDARAVVELLDDYSRTEFGAGAPLATDVAARLIDGLKGMPTYRGWIARLDGRPVGLVNAFIGFSTFLAAPLLNLHDVTVRAEARRRGIARRLIERAIAEARAEGCCRVTLEVRSDNQGAATLYRQLGFGSQAPAGIDYEFLTLPLVDGAVDG